MINAPCYNLTEGHHHFLCSPKALDSWQRKMQHLFLWLLKNHALLEMAKGKQDKLLAWGTGSDLPIHPPPISPLFKIQHQYGWHQAIFGCWLFNRIKAQDWHSKNSKLSHHGHAWLNELIKCTWQMAWAMWGCHNHSLHQSKQLAVCLTLHERVSTKCLAGCVDFSQAKMALF